MSRNSRSWYAQSAVAALGILAVLTNEVVSSKDVHILECALSHGGDPDLGSARRRGHAQR